MSHQHELSRQEKRKQNGNNYISLDFSVVMPWLTCGTTYLGARSNGIQQPASRDCAASSMTTKSKRSSFTSLRGPSEDALVLVAKTTSALVRISVMALSSLSLSSPRRDFISCLRCFFSDGFLDFLTFAWCKPGRKKTLSNNLLEPFILLGGKKQCESKVS